MLIVDHMIQLSSFLDPLITNLNGEKKWDHSVMNNSYLTAYFMYLVFLLEQHMGGSHHRAIQLVSEKHIQCQKCTLK